jgi:glycosyltransferase involved in cell wall biosynthesis
VAVTLAVVIAAYNAQDTLGSQLTALAAQRADVDWEVLVCDNGSTDGTAAVAESYRSRLPLRVVPVTAGQGPSFARNAGVAATDARWLAFVDADDVVADGWLDAVAGGLSAHAFLAGRLDGRRLNDADVLRTRELQQQTGLQWTPVGPGLPHAGAGTLALHRSLFEAVGGFDETMPCLEDTDLCWRVQLETGVPLVFAPDVLVHARLRESVGARWRQGRTYGKAQAVLERRYGADRASVPAGEGPPATGAVSGLLRLVRRPSALVWTLGWHVGHRSGSAVPARPADPPVGTSVVSPAEERVGTPYRVATA